MKKLAALLAVSWVSLRMAVAVGYVVSALVIFAPGVSAATSCDSPPPAPQPPGAQCDSTLACFTTAKGEQVQLPQKPCGGNYVCRSKTIYVTKTPTTTNTCQCAFGSFEMPFLENQKTLDVCDFVNNKKAYATPFAALVAILNQLVGYLTAVTVAVGLVVIVFGGYWYLTAGGDATKVGTAKKIIVTALLGIVLALLGWLILNTISSQFTQPPDPLALAASKLSTIQ